MISLVQLLREVQNNPQAIFLAGPAGSGKSYLSKQLLPQSFNTINSDDTYEEMLKASGIGLKQTNFTPEQLSQAAKMQAQSRKITQDKLTQALENRQNIIIDGTGAASNPILKKKQELESLGYTTLMLMIYVSPLTSLQRNSERERSLMPGIVLRTWRDVNRNIDTYAREFGDNFILINNDPSNANKSFSTALASSYIKQSTATGKPKTPEEQAKSDADKAQLNYDIENMVKTLPSFDTLQTAKSKINIFSNI
jgi:predicted kinase